jgi:secreted PhoX family phosphatase
MAQHDEDRSFDEFDELHNPRAEEPAFTAVAERMMSRRGFMGGTAAMGAAAFLMSAGIGAPRAARAANMSGSWLPFKGIAANSLDTVTVPEGFSWHVMSSWGDPLWSKGVEFDHATRGTGASQELAFGDNNDGMWLFTKDGHSVLAVNNEYTNRKIIYGNRESGLPENADDVRKGKAGHGVTVVEVRNDAGKWGIVKDSPYNRRITADTPVTITGPAAGHDLLKTEADPTGTHSLGTWNNCGNGKTPWGTYLACEENFNGYFSSSDDTYEASAELQRYGVGNKDWGYAWAMTDARFDISKNPNESNRMGYIVEIDPLDPSSTPKKRTALGRFKHENAEVVIADNGQVVVYLGDDERGEFLYKFVSAAKYAELGDNSDLLEDGDLFVAKFNDDGAGEWLALTPETTGMSSRAEVAIHSRIAASKVGATTMDRPEWVAANPMKAEAYCCLTNNKNRAKKPNRGGDETPVGGPNPRAGNNYGQIVRWMPEGGDHTATGFKWDLYVIAGNPTVHKDDRAGSSNVTAENTFNSPDGLSFDSKGGLWIQTDGKYSNKDDFANQGNNQMLLGDTVTGKITRFMVGPNECEITGLAWSADRKTMFVGLQHPGEGGNSHFPGGGDTVPRSSIVAVSRDDGGVMG